MIPCGPTFGVRITHIPTGICVEVNSFAASTVVEARRNALRLLRSRVFANRIGMVRIDNIVASYEEGRFDSRKKHVPLLIGGIDISQACSKNVDAI